MEAVIVATARSPIGRANKGSLVDVRPDDLAATIVKALLEKVPPLDPGEVEDVIIGCAQPGGRAGYNLGAGGRAPRRARACPGVTVNRYCSSSLQTIRMAAHAIKAGEGDVFVAAGVESVSRFDKGSPTAARARTTPCSPTPRRAPRRAPAVATSSWEPLSGLPDIYIAMGQTAENVVE